MITYLKNINKKKKPINFIVFIRETIIEAISYPIYNSLG